MSTEPNRPEIAHPSAPDASPEMTTAEAIALLHRFTCVEKNPTVVLPSRDEIFAALAIVLEDSSYQILGVCAPDLSSGKLSLYQYLAALGEVHQPPLPEQDGPCYIKYNTKNRSCYVAPYDDGYRGVLISCQSSYDDGVNETFGHFPLDLFQPQAN